MRIRCEQARCHLHALNLPSNLGMGSAHFIAAFLQAIELLIERMASELFSGAVPSAAWMSCSMAHMCAASPQKLL